MEWFVIGRDMHVLCNPSTDSPGSLPIDDSGSNQGQTITLTNNVAIGTYDFTTYRIMRIANILRKATI